MEPEASGGGIESRAERPFPLPRQGAQAAPSLMHETGAAKPAFRRGGGIGLSNLLLLVQFLSSKFSWRRSLQFAANSARSRGHLRAQATTRSLLRRLSPQQFRAFGATRTHVRRLGTSPHRETLQKSVSSCENLVTSDYVTSLVAIMETHVRLHRWPNHLDFLVSNDEQSARRQPMKQPRLEFGNFQRNSIGGMPCFSAHQICDITLLRKSKRSLA